MSVSILYIRVHMSKSKQHGGTDVQHGHRHAAWTQIFRMDTDIYMDVDIQYYWNGKLR
jgi:hypothetical protein